MGRRTNRFFSLSPLPEGAAGIDHYVSYGQSPSVGVGTGAVRLTSQLHDSLMFSGGVRAQDGATEPWVQHASLIPLVEAHGPAATGGERYETPVSGIALMSKELGVAPQIIGSAPGQGAVTISTLSKPGVLYERLLDDVRYGRYRARDLGKSYKLRQFFWMQGEADGANNTYAANLNTLRGTIDADVKAITGQTDDVWCISYQLDRPKIGLAHLAASDTYDCIRVAMPMYFLAHTDGVHLTPEGSDIAGAYFALARKQIIDDANEDWQPLRIVGHSVAGAVIDLTYDPVGNLAFDTTTVAAQTNQGFHLFDNADGALTINSVAIVGANVVRITAAATVPAGAVIRYGFTDPTDHTADVSKGNLRDSQGDTIVFEGQGLNYPMHNWALLDQRTVS